MPHRSSILATSLGLGAILFWSTVIAVSRELSEDLGAITSASYIYFLAGAVGLAIARLRHGSFGFIVRVPVRYLVGCGSLMVLYTLSLYLWIGLAVDRTQTIEAGILNYLWPGLTLVFSVPILGRRARAGLVPGILMALAGVVLAMAPHEGWSWEGLGRRLAHGWAYGFALVGAVAWALYSNLSRRWARPDGAEGGAVPVFLLAAGVVLTLVRFVRPETSHWTGPAAARLAYVALFPTLLAYLCWDYAVRRGNITLVASAAYATPLLSTAISCAFLGVVAGPSLWVACGLVIGGAVLCNFSVVERQEVREEGGA
jgi:drug/metabolite transporter (DMT)-like permease